MKFLITGGAGFIGSHLAARLRRMGTVRVLDNFRTGKRENLAGIDVELIEGTIIDPETVRRAMEGIDYVFHLAAMVSVPESVEQPHACVAANVTGLLHVLEAASAAGVRRLCLSSSAAVYGDNPISPKTEDLAPAPRSPYAVTKLDGEYYCAQFAATGRLPTVALRYFNVFGPRQNPRSAYAAAVPIFIEQALRGQPLTVHGDGLQTRDFVHVDDIVAANIFAAVEPGLEGVYNVGYGREITVLELARRVVALTRSTSAIVHAPTRAGDVRHSRADVTRLTRAGFRPVSSFEAGLATTIADFQQRSAGDR